MEAYSIILVDHNLSYLEAAQNILNVHDNLFHIDNATTSDDCIRNLIEKHYDVCLLNFKVNGEDGLKLLSRIKALRKNLPVIMLVDEDHEAIAVRALEQGADDYIMKVSGDRTALPFTVRKVIERNQNQGQRKFETVEIPESVEELEDTTPSSETQFESPQIQSPFYTIDSSGRFLAANAKMAAISGYSEDELLELSLSDLLPQDEEYQFQKWFSRLNSNGEKATFTTELITKYGQRQQVNFVLHSMKNQQGRVVGFQGQLQNVGTDSHNTTFEGQEISDTYQIITELISIINQSLQQPLNHLLERITQVAAQMFRFERVALALLNRKKRVFVKQALIGFQTRKPHESTLLEVPAEVIDKIFSDPYHMKVMYYHRDGIVDLQGEALKKQMHPDDLMREKARQFSWQDDDMFILNLVDQNQHTFGYLSFEKPLDGARVNPDIAYHLEIFGKLASMAVENHQHYAALERKNRRLKQLLVANNIFKLHLNLTDLLKEVVWSVKTSLDFNLVGLALIFSKSTMLELRAVACEDKIKLIQLEELRFGLNEIKSILKEPYKHSHSYLIEDKNGVFKKLKDIYYGSRNQPRPGDWKRDYLLLVPLRSRDQRISGFLMVDDPLDGKFPSMDVIRTLEILANQVGIAIDNRMMYFQMKKRMKFLEKISGINTPNSTSPQKEGVQRLIQKFFK
ncbi:response regulator [candidate division KSB1 bacterium]|nr:response regulator [candidate division KSB1 bacterium]